MNNSVKPNRAFISSSRLRIWARMETSSAETGSSQTMNSGLRMSARAMQMRWHCPPENSCGSRPTTRVGIEPDGAEHLVDELARASPDP